MATLPFAVVIGSLSPVAIVLMKRLGTTAVVAAGLVLMSAGFVLAAGSAVDSAYWGRIVAAMVLMAAGLALTTGPATEAIMGALPAARVGAGSAVNDTTREIGGTLGVAIVGSVMNSIYGSQLAAALSGTSLTPEQISAASRSVTGGFEAASLVPAGEVGVVVGVDIAGLHGRSHRRIPGGCRGDRARGDRGVAVPARPAPRRRLSHDPELRPTDQTTCTTDTGRPESPLRRSFDG